MSLITLPASPRPTRTPAATPSSAGLAARLRGWFARLSRQTEAKDMLPAPRRAERARRTIPENQINSLLL